MKSFLHYLTTPYQMQVYSKHRMKGKLIMSTVIK